MWRHYGHECHSIWIIFRIELSNRVPWRSERRAPIGDKVKSDAVINACEFTLQQFDISVEVNCFWIVNVAIGSGSWWWCVFSHLNDRFKCTITPLTIIAIDCDGAGHKQRRQRRRWYTRHQQVSRFTIWWQFACRRLRPVWMRRMRQEHTLMSMSCVGFFVFFSLLDFLHDKLQCKF